MKQDITVTHPQIAAEWDYDRNGDLLPSYVSKGMTKEAYWKCPNGHSYPARIDHRCSMKSGCPYCSHKKPLPGETDLVTVYPEIAAEWDFEHNDHKPEEYLPFPNKRVNWICPKCGKEKSDAARHRNILARRGTLADQCPELMSEWDYNKNEKGPECFTRGSKEFAWWKCSKWHSWQARIYSRARDKNPGGCPTCAGRLRCINLDTGEVFENYTEAAKSVGVTRKAITFAIRHKTHCKGYRWDRIGERSRLRKKAEKQPPQG